MMMMMTTTTLHCIADQDAEHYFRFMVKCAHDLASSPDDLVFNRIIPSGKGSNGHANGLMQAFKDFNPEHINVIADSDTVVLCRGWDMRLQEVFSIVRQGNQPGDRVDILGGLPEPLNGVCRGTGPKQMHGRVIMTWTAFAPNVTLVGHDFSPDKGRHHFIIDEQDSKRWALPIGHDVLCDTAWRLPIIYDEMDLRVVGLKNRRLNSLPGCETLDKAHELWMLDTGSATALPFVAHQRSSCNHRFMGDAFSKSFYESCERILMMQIHE